MLRRTVPLLLLACLAPACLDDGLSSGEAQVADGTPEAIGLLRFLNSAAADVETLDIDAALDVRAARNIVAHVRGADGLLGTTDDDLLDDLAELDAIPQVGPATIARLTEYVRSIGGIPDLDVEGVLMTQAEAAAIVAAANGASLTELDDLAGLDARAARGLVDRRPHADIHAVAAVGYVGPVALEKLRLWAPTWSPPVVAACDPQLKAGMRACVESQLADDAALSIAEAAAICGDAELLGPVFDQVCAGPLPPAFCALSYEAFYTTAVPACVAELAADLAPLCRTTTDCGGLPLRCVGFANDGSSVLGVCVDTSRRTGNGASCSLSSPCQAGLVCTGLTFGGGGICNPDWQQGTYETYVPVVVPATAGATVVSKVVAIGQATVPVDLEVSVDLNGVDPRRLRLVLSDPNGAEAVIWNGATGGATLPERMIALGQISRDDYVNGYWTLTATTIATGTAGTITGWRLFMTSRYD